MQPSESCSFFLLISPLKETKDLHLFYNNLSLVCTNFIFKRFFHLIFILFLLDK